MQTKRQLQAENKELKRWIIEASSAFRQDGGEDTLEEAVGLVRMCHAGAEALGEMEYVTAWKRLCFRLGLPAASHVETVLLQSGLTPVVGDAAGSVQAEQLALPAARLNPDR